MSYIETKKSFKVTYGDNIKYISYHKKEYGKYAELMAKYTSDTGIKLNNYYEYDEELNCHIMIIYSKRYDAYYKVYIDDDIIENVMEIRWFVDFHKTTIYARSKSNKVNEIYGVNSLLLHQLVMNNIGKGYKDIIDHINSNGLDNRRCNLRIVTHSQNNRNRRSSSKHSIWRNVIYRPDQNSFVVNWVDDITNKSSQKSFAVDKYGYLRAKHKAIRKSIEMRKLNNYQLSDDDLEYDSRTVLILSKKKKGKKYNGRNY